MTEKIILTAFVCDLSNINMEAKVFVFLYSFLRLCLCSNVKMPKYPYQLYKEYSSTRVMFYLLSFFFVFFSMKITIQVCYKLCAFGAYNSKCPNNLYSVNSFWNKT